MNKKELIKSARKMLGEPIVDVELEDEQMISLITDAHDSLVLYANVGNLSEKDYHFFQKFWVKEYFYALCKETLARVRGKYNGNLPITKSNMTLNYKELLIESKREKELLKYLILKDDNVFQNSIDVVLVFYVNVGNMDKSSIDSLMRDIRDSLDGKDDFIKYFIPINEGETRIECLNLSEKINANEETIKKLNGFLQKIIENHEK